MQNTIFQLILDTLHDDLWLILLIYLDFARHKIMQVHNIKEINKSTELRETSKN